MSEKTPGQILYEAYKAESGGVSLVSGAVLPAWGDLEYTIQAAWEASADALADNARMAMEAMRIAKQDAFRERDEAREQLVAVTRQRDEAEDENRKLTAEAENSAAMIRQLHEKLSAVTGERNAARLKVSALNARVEHLEDALNEAENEIHHLTPDASNHS